ncbi:uncharacterized protein EDB91DRAFT_141776 [Suillus paluster]|uniref:uncharacterized protein n=1 Tax=Suillus paluster TaxID=48578 RepID=UPI001B885ED3|nr:uncharacterized protein EDB91DRAFT_141776 [Suillus paluster]KAG1724379.1 hypothetical protein EDB91DRAFT_141776 [Suillus paluster]
MLVDKRNDYFVNALHCGLYDLARSRISEPPSRRHRAQSCSYGRLNPKMNKCPVNITLLTTRLRTLFGLHDHDQATVNIFSGLQVVADTSHIRYLLESEYWTHCERYPNHQMDRVKLLEELREVVMHASAEIITSDMSLSPFDAGELSRILELINHLKENAEENNFPHSTGIIMRFMHYFCL